MCRLGTLAPMKTVMQPVVAAVVARAARGVAVVAIAVAVTACASTPRSDSVADLSAAEAALGRPVEVAAGEIRGLDHPDFDPAAAAHALWSPLEMLRDRATGIFFLEPYDPKRIPVLFIPGIRGTPRNFRSIIESLDRSHFQAWVFNYPTGLRTESAVALLDMALAEIERKHRFRTLFITAHSLGGLVGYGYLKAGSPGSARVKMLATFATPWMGNSWAAVGARSLPSPVPVWTDLSPGSPFLASLRAPPGRDASLPPHYVFFGFRQEMRLLSTECSDGVISLASQLPSWIQDRAAGYWGYDASHAGILSDRDARQRYRRVLESAAERVNPGSGEYVGSPPAPVNHL